MSWGIHVDPEAPGRFRVWSTVTDSWVVTEATRAELEAVYVLECGERRGLEAVERGVACATGERASDLGALYPGPVVCHPTCGCPEGQAAAVKLAAPLRATQRRVIETLYPREQKTPGEIGGERDARGVGRSLYGLARRGIVQQAAASSREVLAARGPRDPVRWELTELGRAIGERLQSESGAET